jgi:protein-tyrosine-phosphatase
MAEAMLNRLDSEHFDAMSAGIDRGTINPLTVDVMKSMGVDLTARCIKTVRELTPLEFDFVITLCDRARFECPKVEGAEFVHWRLDNPLAEPDLVKQKRMFRSLCDQIAQRVRLFALVQVRAAVA